jgi:hypothetical protein
VYQAFQKGAILFDHRSHVYWFKLYPAFVNLQLGFFEKITALSFRNQPAFVEILPTHGP